MIDLILLGLLAAGLALLGWWLFVSTEGVYLGRRVVILLYDLYAQHYDDVKNYRPEYEQAFLAQPLMTFIAPMQSPLVLDVATGTGRLPLALLNHRAFQGRVVALDLSRRMLRIAAYKLRGSGERAPLLWCPAESLPFADGAFDVVVCLESLEFMTRPERVLQEAIRVLRPGGLLLITNRINTRAMPGKTWTTDQICDLLAKYGLSEFRVDAWQVDYEQVWAIKDGHSQPVGARPLGEVLRCPQCRRNLMIEQDGAWVCEGCGGRARIGADGVVELFAMTND